MQTNQDSQLIIVTERDRVDLQFALVHCPESESLTYDEMIELARFRDCAAAKQLERQVKGNQL